MLGISFEFFGHRADVTNSPYGVSIRSNDIRLTDIAVRRLSASDLRPGAIRCSDGIASGATLQRIRLTENRKNSGFRIEFLKGSTLTDLAVTNPGRTAIFLSKDNDQPVTVDRFDNSNTASTHGNGLAFYDDIKDLTLRHFSARNNILPFALSNTAGAVPAHLFESFHVTTPIAADGSSMGTYSIDFRSSGGGIVFRFGVAGFRYARTGGSGGAGVLWDRCVIDRFVQSDNANGHALRNCLVYRWGGNSCDAAAFTADGGVVEAGTTFVNAEYPGWITDQAWEHITRNGAGGYEPRNIGWCDVLQDFDWKLPAWSAGGAPWAAPRLDIVELALGWPQGVGIGSVIQGAPGWEPTLPAGQGDNDLFILRKQQPQPLADITVARAYTLVFDSIRGAETNRSSCTFVVKEL